MNDYAISFRISDANGATDSSSTFFTALSPGTYRVIASADNVGLIPATTLTVNSQVCQVATFTTTATTNVTIPTAGPIPVSITITNQVGNPVFALNPMGMAFTIQGPI
jgi:hypothetical protein